MMFAHMLPAERLSEIMEIQTRNIRAELEILQGIIQQQKGLTPGMRFTLEYGIAANSAVLGLIERRREPLLNEIVESS